METKLIEFVVETRGHCFICLIKLEPGLQEESTSSSVVYSLDELSRYLKVDRRKVFKEKAPVPPHLLAKVEKSILKSELCNVCASINEKLVHLLSSKQTEPGSKAFDFKVIVYLTIIHEKLRNSKETGLLQNFRKFIALIDSLESSRNWSGKLEIVEALRKDAMQKCFQQLRCFLPQVQIANLTMEEVTAEQQKLQKSRVLPRPSTVGNSKYLPFMEILSAYSMKERLTAWKQNSSTDLTTGRCFCKLCQKTYSSIRHFHKHFNPVHLKIRYRCLLCEREYTTRQAYRAHHQAAHIDVIDLENISPRCHVCRKVFPTFSLLSEHFKVVHSEMSEIVCNSCGDEFATFNELNKHFKRSHHEKRRGDHICSKCGKSFNFRSNLSKHQRLVVNCKMSKLKHADEVHPPLEHPLMKGLTKKIKSESNHVADNNQSTQPEPIMDNEGHNAAIIEVGEVKVERIFPNSELGLEHGGSRDSDDEQQSEDLESSPVLEDTDHGGINLCPQSSPGVKDKDCFDIPNVDSDHPPRRETKRMMTRKKANQTNSKKPSPKVNIVLARGNYKQFIKVIRPRTPSTSLSSEDNEVDDKPLDLKERYQCSLCDKTFPSRENCRRHLHYVHAGKKKWKKPKINCKCMLCQKVMIGAKQFKRHLREAHLKHKEPRCDHCDHKFSSPDQLYNHLKTIHADQLQHHFCEVCGMGFSLKHYLERHQRNVKCGQIKPRKGRKVLEPLPKKPPKDHICHCEHCGEGFTRKDNLYKHIRAVHLQVRRYECNQCSKRFKTGVHLKVHVKSVHMKIKDFACDICGKRFGRSYHLTTHKRRVECGKTTN